MRTTLNSSEKQRRERARAFASLKVGHIWAVRCVCTPDHAVMSVCTTVRTDHKLFECGNCGRECRISNAAYEVN